MRPRTVRFKENDFITSNLAWDAVNGEFKMKRGDAHFAKSEESEDELNDYANYRNLDPDYVRYLKEIRRAKRRSQQQQQKQQQQQQQQYRRSQEQTVEEEDEYEEEEEVEEEEAIPAPIPLTPNIGITSITNTNVLMNDTLERMKHSLNRINSQIMEKKGAGLEGEELEDLHFQLAQTEYQMAKILKIVNSAADSFNASILSPPPLPPSAIYQRNGQNYDDDSESEEDEDEIQERIEYEEETEIVETTKYVKANRSSSSSSNSSSSASLSSISSSPFNRSSSDGTKQTTHKSNSETKTTLNNDSNKPMLSEESLRKRRLKKKNNRKRAKLNKKNKNKADFESKKEA